MRSHPGTRRGQAYVVTEARQSRAEEMSQRERRYFLMMGLRVVCFVIAVVLLLNHLGWLAILPATGAIVLPYFAVVVANSRRVTGASGGFRPYEPQLPERYVPPQGSTGQDGGTRPGS